MSYEGVAEDLEQPRPALTASTTKGVNRRANVDLNEPAFFQHTPPACARQATGNSVGPQVDVADSGFRHRLACGNVGELQPSTRAQHPHNLVEDTALVGAEIDDAIADDDIGPTVVDRQILDDPPAELDIAEAHGRRLRARPLQHLVGSYLPRRR